MTDDVVGDVVASSSSGTTRRRPTVSLLDYGAGNVRSVRNAILACGYRVIDVVDPSDVTNAEVLIFPGVGSYRSAMEVLRDGRGYDVALGEYLRSDRPYLGICLGMQTLFDYSEEGIDIDDDGGCGGGPPLPGLGIIPGGVVRFDEDGGRRSVPHIGWNGIVPRMVSPAMRHVVSSSSSSGARRRNDDDETKEEEEGGGAGGGRKKEGGGEVYFVHSYYAPITTDNVDWVLTSTTYEGREYISSVQRGNVVATQFHPEKSGKVGLDFLRGFLEASSGSVEDGTLSNTSPIPVVDDDDVGSRTTRLVKRVVVALDVRTNDDGDLVVTKGDQYDVREKGGEVDDDTGDGDGGGGCGGRRGGVRNLGKPVRLAKRYYDEGADEVAFLNITSYRSGVVDDMPMLRVLEESSKSIFVPLTVGGGIRSYTDPESGASYTALEVASRYFRAGADKVSIGSDAVYAAEEYVRSGGKRTGLSSIETISRVYGVQAVVISIDPRRVYVSSPDDASCARWGHVVVSLSDVNGPIGPDGETYCWYQCTVKGGREARPICAVTLARAAESLGAGEIMLNCIDMDGRCDGYDIALMNAVSSAVNVPVIASSGAGNEGHFVEVFERTGVRAALAAGMFHRGEVEICSVKRRMEERGIPARMV
ncbi:hypothetical protein ACHAW5_002044 [Stephanodiscus triporus]|uniref:Glutamine amidotransferase domain-containing protein n=1 Tax=Stephanodiscus triporus TaxID=2934178 RepID=A0ABD3QLM8_9STRA